MCSKRGFTVLGVVIALGMLAAMGAGLATLMATNQSARIQQLSSDQAFYSSHAATEFALRQIIVSGSTDLAMTRQFAGEPFSISRSGGNVIVTATKNDARAQFHLTDPRPPTDASCLVIDSSTARIGPSPPSSTYELQNVIFRRAPSCTRTIRIVSLTISWQPDNAEKLYRINIDGTAVYSVSSSAGLRSGSTFNITDQSLSTGVDHILTYLRFDRNVDNHNFIISFNLSDGSQATSTVNFLAPDQQSCLVVDTVPAFLAASSGVQKDLKSFTLRNSCSLPIRIDKVTTSWTPTSPSRTLTELQLQSGMTLYSVSAASGTLVEVDHVILATTTHTVVRFRFSAEMLGRNYTIVWTMADGTTRTTDLPLFAVPENTCLTVNTSSVTRGGSSLTEIRGVLLQNTCSADIGITGLITAWGGIIPATVRAIRIDGVTRYSSGTGVGSSVLADFGANDVYRQDGLGTFPIDYIRFNATIPSGMLFGLKFILADGSTIVASARVP